MTGLDLAAIRRRLPDVSREDMSYHEQDRADLLAEVDRLAAEIAALREQIQRAVGFAQQRALTAHALGDLNRERQWLDLIILLEHAALDGDQPKPRYDEDRHESTCMYVAMGNPCSPVRHGDAYLIDQPKPGESK